MKISYQGMKEFHMLARKANLGNEQCWGIWGTMLIGIKPLPKMSFLPNDEYADPESQQQLVNCCRPPSSVSTAEFNMHFHLSSHSTSMVFSKPSSFAIFHTDNAISEIWWINIIDCHYGITPWIFERKADKCHIKFPLFCTQSNIWIVLKSLNNCTHECFIVLLIIAKNNTIHLSDIYNVIRLSLGQSHLCYDSFLLKMILERQNIHTKWVSCKLYINDIFSVVKFAKYSSTCWPNSRDPFIRLSILLFVNVLKFPHAITDNLLTTCKDTPQCSQTCVPYLSHNNKYLAILNASFPKINKVPHIVQYLTLQ